MISENLTNNGLKMIIIIKNIIIDNFLEIKLLYRLELLKLCIKFSHAMEYEHVRFVNTEAYQY